MVHRGSLQEEEKEGKIKERKISCNFSLLVWFDILVCLVSVAVVCLFVCLHFFSKERVWSFGEVGMIWEELIERKPQPDYNISKIQ